MTCWSSWSPRLGVAYDLFGNGKTALKASFGRYQRPDVSTFANQFNPVALAFENRTWTDTDRSGLSLPTNGDGIAQDNEIGPSGNPNFGKITNRTLDPNFTREYNQQYSAGIQHELRPGMAVTLQLVPPHALQHAIQRQLQRQRRSTREPTPTGRRSRSSTR